MEKSRSRLATFRRIELSSGMTTGRIVRLWEAIGEIRMQAAIGRHHRPSDTQRIGRRTGWGRDQYAVSPIGCDHFVVDVHLCRDHIRTVALDRHFVEGIRNRGFCKNSPSIRIIVRQSSRSFPTSGRQRPGPFPVWLRWPENRAGRS